VRSAAEFVWVPETFLHERGLDPDPGSLGKFPFWHSDPSHVGFFQISSKKAFDAVWRTRPFEETAIDYVEWLNELDGFEWHDELAPDIEARVLGQWVARDRG
jgi:hypothetical protein